MFEHHIKYFIFPPIGGSVSLHGSAFLAHRPFGNFGQRSFIFVFELFFLQIFPFHFMLEFLYEVLLVLPSLSSDVMVPLFTCRASYENLLLLVLLVFVSIFFLSCQVLFNC